MHGKHGTYMGLPRWQNSDAVPFNEIADCSRGELRLAAEVAIAEIHGRHVSTCAHERAVSILQTIASA